MSIESVGENDFAEESIQLQRAREKLEASFSKNVITKEQVERKVQQIKEKFDRIDPNHSREIITEKAFTIFDNNQNPAPASEKIKKLSSQLGLDAKA